MTTILETSSMNIILSQITAPSAGVSIQVDLVPGMIQAFILGIVQGITEFLPISSTAHLLIFTKVFGWKELGSKDFVDAKVMRRLKLLKIKIGKVKIGKLLWELLRGQFPL